VKLEINLEGKQIARVLAIAAIGVILGYSLSFVTGTESTGLVPMGTGNYITSSDLNREDLGLMSIITSQNSRFCEGMGLVSSVYWQQDDQGNTYGMPICLEKTG